MRILRLELFHSNYYFQVLLMQNIKHTLKLMLDNLQQSHIYLWKYLLLP